MIYIYAPILPLLVDAGSFGLDDLRGLLQPS